MFGAERWIRQHPDRLFLDKSCRQPFPLEMPDPDRVQFHRVVVAHGVADRCRMAIGGSGSLRIVPDIVGGQHCSPADANYQPFAVGQIDPARGFVHVLDDASLEKVMAEIDTVSDFVTYLTDKERLIRDGRLAGAEGEEDLLALYLYPVEGKDENAFSIPALHMPITAEPGLWNEFERDTHRVARKRANDPSYLWDHLIELMSEQALAGTLRSTPPSGIPGTAACLQMLARERRTRRRLLSIALRDLITETPPAQSFRAVRVNVPTEPENPYYDRVAKPLHRSEPAGAAPRRSPTGMDLTGPSSGLQ